MKKNLNLLLLSVIFFVFVSSLPVKDYYDELFRPQFHFSPEKNWQLDPNGLVFHEGLYHMFYRIGTDSGKVVSPKWGHAVSKDLLYWQHFPEIQLNENEDIVPFSGCAVSDKENILGLNEGNNKTLAMYYSFEGDEAYYINLAFSIDNGITWNSFSENPLLTFDKTEQIYSPKIFWHETSQKWIMILSRRFEDDERNRGISFFSSDNLIDWEYKSHIIAIYGAPDIVELQVKNRPEEKKWVIFGGDGSYVIGDFDGESFTLETSRLRNEYSTNFSYPVTWNNFEKGPVQIAWLRGGKYPEMPFNGQMTFPVELSLMKEGEEYQLMKVPIDNINDLYGKDYDWEERNIIPGINDNVLKRVKGDCIHIKGVFNLKTTDNFGFYLMKGKNDPGVQLVYNTQRNVLSCLGTDILLPPENDKITLEILVDRTSIEIFANNGKTIISKTYNPTERSDEYELFTYGGELFVEEMKVQELKSVWEVE